jgi:hypothetical protein
LLRHLVKLLIVKNTKVAFLTVANGFARIKSPQSVCDSGFQTFSALDPLLRWEG